MAEERSARREGERHLEATTRHMVGGEDGVGLVKTFWGLGVTALGVVLQGVAALLG